MKKAIKLEYIDVKKLIPYARNARTHSETQIKQIAASVKEFGFNNPVLIDKDNGIIAGHGRVMAAELLKLDSVPCVRLEHLSDTQKRAYILADNRLSELSGWNDEMLNLEIEDLKLADFDIDLTGFVFDLPKISVNINDFQQDEDKSEDESESNEDEPVNESESKEVDNSIKVPIYCEISKSASKEFKAIKKENGFSDGETIEFLIQEYLNA